MDFARRLWPFRRGDDDIFNQTHTKETIYDALGAMPKNNYETELRNYIEGRWRRGFIQSVVPTTLLGSFVGFFVGIQQATYRNRHDPRIKVIASSIGGFAMLGLGVSGSHHMLIVKNNYNDSALFPMLAGVTGSTIFAFFNGVNAVYGSVTGIGVGATYALACYGVRWFEERRIRNFLATAQNRDTPVHKVAPELQPLYRTFLFEFRPIEESSELRRRAMLYSRDEHDSRIDTESMLFALQPEFVSWISFPDWWPLKVATGNVEQQTLINARRKGEEYTRRYTGLLKDHDGVALKHVFRTKDHVETNIGKFDISAHDGIRRD